MGDPAALPPPQIMVPPPPISVSPVSVGEKRSSSLSPSRSGSGSMSKRPMLTLDTDVAMVEELPFLPPRTPATRNAGRRTALHDAIVAADEAALVAALDGLPSPAFINFQDELGFTPLITAAGLEAGAGVGERLVRLLLARDADPSSTDLGGFTGAHPCTPARRCALD